jgi:putative glutamine amidotransferase
MAAPSMKKPLIGCTTYRKTAEDPPMEIIGLMPSYIEAIRAAGGLPVMIPLGVDAETIRAILERVDGVLLPGGGDMDPAAYRAANGGKCYDIDADRDRVEVLVAQTAVASSKPLLAICRGHQVLNVALGGTLWEDIESEMPHAIAHDHYRKLPRTHLAHTVKIAPDSCLARLMGMQETAVNSLHHQGIRDLAPDLTPTAVAADGLIEAVEIPQHPFALGVQWHPENLIHDMPQMLALFKGLVDAAATYH